MKTLCTLVATAVISITAAFASHQDVNRAEAVKVWEIANHQFRLIYPFQSSEKVTVILKNTKGKVVYQKAVKNSQRFMLPLDLSSASDGKYTVEITDEQGTISKTIEKISNGKLSVVAVNDGVYKVLVAGVRQSDINIAIYDEKFNLLVNEKYQDMIGLTRVYDLTSFGTSKFTFEVTGQGHINSFSTR